MYKTSVYTHVNGSIQGIFNIQNTLKTAKITKGDTVRITLTVCQCAAE